MTTLAKADSVIRQAAGKLAIVAMSLGMTLVPGVAAAAAEPEQHDMHSMHADAAWGNCAHDRIL